VEAGCSERISKRQIAKRTQEILEAQRQRSIEARGMSLITRMS